ncbi:MAG: archaellar assembly protein FlaJ [Candidatus Thermoplasmatota archaeon]|nr:archaellar assembly protein FlaJ [Candidatus Thermoplasmatota archaeon]MCL6089695.1 archaellar assembly protein FlaJ [Candidatus Thermoplasmatota archaeon]MDA8143594.1 type II secretion system F family protein [Thermoplasmatales archaeon]
MVVTRGLAAITRIELKRNDVIIIGASFVAITISIVLYDLLNYFYALGIAAIGGMVVMSVLLRPILVRDAAKTDINSNIPYFMTAFATLSVSAANRIDILEILSKKEKLGMIGEEIAKLVNLVKNWRRGLSEAAMFLSGRSPSEIFEDFLARFGHAINSGQDFEEFVETESETVMNNFETTYMSALYTFDLYKDLYVSMLLSFAFLVTFIMIMPILIHINIIQVLSLSLLTIILGEALLVYGIKVVLPNDPIWHDTGIKTPLQLKIQQYTILSVMSCFVLFIVSMLVSLWNILPFYVVIAIIVTPLFVPGYVGSKAERIVAKKDEMFGSFIRSLAGSAAARGNMIIDALKSIVLHDFGTLTVDIRALYRRLAYRINNMQSWKNFSADTGSHLIEVFSESFVESVDLGANADKAGSVVADNFDRVIRLRKRRHASVSSYTGVIYGITGGLAFSLAIAFGVLEIINKVFSTFNVSSLNSFGIFVSQPASSIFTIEAFIVTILLIHSFIAGTALKFADGGKVVHGLHHFVIMTWIVTIVMYGTLQITTIILGGAI